MDYRDVDIPALADELPHLRVGLTALENNYRDLQHALNPDLAPEPPEAEELEPLVPDHLGDALREAEKKLRRIQDVVAGRAAVRAAMEVLAAQVAQHVGVKVDDADTALKGHAHRVWGLPESPKGWAEWNDK